MDVDLLVVGSGPVGLYATYYAGFRGRRTAVIDSLPEPGGQISALYPEKLIYDIAGLPAVRGRDLVAGLLDQANTYTPQWLLGQSAQHLQRLPDGRLRILTTTGTDVTTRAIVLAAGTCAHPMLMDFRVSGYTWHTLLAGKQLRWAHWCRCETEREP